MERDTESRPCPAQLLSRVDCEREPDLNMQAIGLKLAPLYHENAVVGRTKVRWMALCEWRSAGVSVPDPCMGFMHCPRLV